MLWLLEELALPYDVRMYQRDPKTMLAPPELREVHPLGKSPVITDGDLTLAESGAIIDYIVDRHGSHLAPASGTPEKVRYLYWLHYAEGSLMPPLLMKLVFDQIEKAKVPFLVRPVVKAIASKARNSFVLPQLKRHLDYMEAELDGRDWFSGDAFTAADIQMSYPLEAAQARVGLEKYPRLGAWLQRIHARPAYQRAVQRVGEFGVPTND